MNLKKNGKMQRERALTVSAKTVECEHCRRTRAGRASLDSGVVNRAVGTPKREPKSVPDRAGYTTPSDKSRDFRSGLSCIRK